MTLNIQTTLYHLLDYYKDKRYRKGLLQGFLACYQISLDEYESLCCQVANGVRKPRISEQETA